MGIGPGGLGYWIQLLGVMGSIVTGHPNSLKSMGKVEDKELTAL